MEWNEKLQRIINYIEDHLQCREEPINMVEISIIAGCSYGFFQKVFSYMNKISLADYIRYRKLTLAGYDLKSTTMKVIEVSYKYGYDSPTSFTKAFQNFHGVTPTQARQSTISLKVYPKMQLQQKQRYDWKLSHNKALHLVGKSITLSKRDQQLITKIPMFWHTCQRDGSFASLVTLDTNEPKGMFGIFLQDNPLSDNLVYGLMVCSSKSIPEGFITYELPSETWAVFDCYGPVPQAIQQGWKFLEQEWLIQYPFQHAPCPSLEWYSDGNVYDQDYLSQIWIPIIEEEQ